MIAAARFFDAAWAVADATAREHARRRSYLLVVFFGAVLVGAGVLTASLASEERLRVLLDAGLAAIEMIALLTAVLSSATLVLDDIESRVAHLVLCRPAPRAAYVVGRWAGVMAAVAAAMAAMAALHLGALAFSGWTWRWAYPAALAASGLKVAMVGALALAVSLVTTSSASALSVTGFLWVLGHFGEELKALGERSGSPVVGLAIKVGRCVIPDLGVLNVRELWGAAAWPGPGWWAGAVVYLTFYTAACLAASAWLFEQRES